MHDSMEDRNINIIFLIKQLWNINEAKMAIIKYMSEECNCPEEVYTDYVLEEIIRNVAYDFLTHTTRKNDSINFAFALMKNRYDKMPDNIIRALSYIQVRLNDNGNLSYINGWRETEFIKNFDIEKWIQK